MFQQDQVLSAGCGDIVTAMVGNQELFNQVKNVVLTSQGPAAPMLVLSYPLLPVSPFSPDWSKRGSTMMIRNALKGMITAAGYGKYGKKLGTGPPPLGWPEEVSWDTFEGVA